MDKKCSNCGKSFQSPIGFQKYCGEDCRNATRTKNKSKNRNVGCFVYFIGYESNINLFKVGITTSKVSERIKELQTGSPFILVCYQLFQFFNPEDSRKVERYFHNNYKKTSANNEWVFLPDELEITNTCDKLKVIVSSIARVKKIESNLSRHNNYTEKIHIDELFKAEMKVSQGFRYSKQHPYN